MNIEKLPTDIRNDIENQSLRILAKISDEIIVIGGWAVRAHLGENHHRYTLDVDGVSHERNLANIERELECFGFTANHPEWGIQFLKRYRPSVVIPNDLKGLIENIDIRIEISEPRIKEAGTNHFFEFRLSEYEVKAIPYHNAKGEVLAKVPPLEHMAAVKLGLPVDYKNNHDAAMLLQRSDLSLVVDVILSNDDWREIVLRRLPKSKGRIVQRDRLENTLALAAGLDIKEHIRKLNRIEHALMKP